MDALKSLNEIKRAVGNPELLSYKISANQGNVWRNAYYLSTSIEESNMRKSLQSTTKGANQNNSTLD